MRKNLFEKNNKAAVGHGRPPGKEKRLKERLFKIIGQPHFTEITKEEAEKAKSMVFGLAEMGNETFIKLLWEASVAPQKRMVTTVKKTHGNKLKSLIGVADAMQELADQLVDSVATIEDVTAVSNIYEKIYRMRKEEKLDRFETVASDSEDRIKEIAASVSQK